MANDVRVRMAPSPTGYFHIGSARTALFNYLYARANGGKFLIRIEDTDRERSEDRYTENILESLQWLGMAPDEEPLFQYARLEHHRAQAQKLLEEGKAYYCDCSPEALDAYRAKCQAEKKPFRYPGTCREAGKSGGVVRLKMPREGGTSFDDLIRGTITIPNKEVDDWVVLRANGNPTYNFVVVIDDHDQGITHVLRGEDHIGNTPKQMQVYTALGWEAPKFGHLPMILGKDRSKLSKRHGAAATTEYRDMGYLPEALVNFLARLGWSHGDKEILSRAELEKAFNLEAVGKSGAVFDTEKLDWLQGHYMREKPAGEMTRYLTENFSSDLGFLEGVSQERVERAVALGQEKEKLVPEVINQLRVVFGEDPGEYPENKRFDSHVITDVAKVMEASDFTVEDLSARVKGYSKETGTKFGIIGSGLRYAVGGGKATLDLFGMLSVMGKDTVLRRIGNALNAQS